MLVKFIKIEVLTSYLIMLRIICILITSAVFFGCSRQSEQKLFVELPSDKTGITFSNTVVQSGENNVLNYPYYFNGGGVAVGDINNDGLADVYFSGNQVANKLYLNKGNLQFEDITGKAGVAAAEGWKTGVSMVDINQDGWLDIYVCRSAMGDSVLRKNLLFINKGDLSFTEKAEEYGVADNSYSTHAAFFDYDKDGDLDLFVLNHSLPKYAGFNNMLVNFKKQKGSKFQSKLYQNSLGKFSDISEKAGIINNLLSFGLGLAVSDVNKDGWPDVYVSNDFNEEDYLYINNQDGTFTNAIREATGHVSLFSMGSDIADVNNDALPDIFTLDMLPESNERIKLSSGDDNYDKYRILINAGFHHQSMRNMLQLNNGDGTFSEIGQLMGISNTDWSWSSLFADFDGDGWKDLFVSNGYEKDYTNMQFLKYTVDERLKSRQTGVTPNVDQIIGQMPSIQVGNFIFKNNGNLTFTKKSEDWGVSRLFKSNGAAYADLDNDGDLDLVVNTMNEKSLLYRNTASENKKANFLKVDLRKSNPETVLEGVKVIVYAAGNIQYQEFSSVRGFQSSMYVPLTFGLANQSIVDSIRVIWPDNKTELIKNVPIKDTVIPRYEDAKGVYAYPTVAKPLFEETHVLDWKHDAVDTNDFKRQLLLPKMYSYSGPKMAKGDVNEDGFEDLYVCGARYQPGILFLQEKDGSFKEKKNSDFERDKDFQDEDAIFFDADQDGDLDLYLVSGGYLFNEKDPLLQDRLYLNDGQANFLRSSARIPAETLAGSCVVSLDVDNDEDLDLFIGTRLIPGSYPISSQSIVLVNDGQGNFTNKTTQHLSSEDLGMVCDAVSLDINKDGAQDLIVAGEWTPIRIFVNTNNQLLDETDKWLSTPTKGWWNCLVAEDFDKDGDVDFMAGNYGLNNQFGVSSTRPATLVYKDFNGDGQVDPFFSYYIGQQSFPYASRDEALGQVAFLKSRFTDYTQYAHATLETIFKKEELQNAERLEADVLRTMYFENEGDSFKTKHLPVEAQFSPIYAIAPVDVDKDGDIDVVMGGNESKVRVRLGISDANRGSLLINDGAGNFSYMSQPHSGLNVIGDVRSIIPIGDRIVFGINDDKVRAFKLHSASPSNLN
jgi:hypothetical protein